MTTLAANKPYRNEDGRFSSDRNEYREIVLENLVLWSIASLSLTSILGWACVAVYLTVVLLVTILICGIQLVILKDN